MSENDTESAQDAQITGQWFDNKTLVIAWILTFFPVGLYGLWKNQEFIRNIKLGVTVAVVMAFVLGINFTHPLYVFVAFPVGVFLLWRDRSDLGGLWKRFALAYPVVLILALLQAANAPTGGGGILGGSCSAVITEGNCTYFRDDDCNVISKSCS